MVAGLNSLFKGQCLTNKPILQLTQNRKFYFKKLLTKF